MGDGVLQEAGDDTMQCMRVAADPDRLVRGIHREAVAGIHHQRGHIRSDVAGQRREVDTLGLAAMPVKPLQIQQLLGDVAQPAQIQLQSRTRVAGRQVGQARGQDRDRHAQLMRSTGEEAVLCVVAFADAAHGRIEGIHQRVDLQRYRTRIQAAAALVDLDCGRLRRHSIDPAQRAMDHPRRHHQRDHQHRQCDPATEIAEDQQQLPHDAAFGNAAHRHVQSPFGPIDDDDAHGKRIGVDAGTDIGLFDVIQPRHQRTVLHGHVAVDQAPAALIGGGEPERRRRARHCQGHLRWIRLQSLGAKGDGRCDLVTGLPVDVGRAAIAVGQHHRTQGQRNGSGLDQADLPDQIEGQGVGFEQSHGVSLSR